MLGVCMPSCMAGAQTGPSYAKYGKLVGHFSGENQFCNAGYCKSILRAGTAACGYLNCRRLCPLLACSIVRVGLLCEPVSPKRCCQCTRSLLRSTERR